MNEIKEMIKNIKTSGISRKLDELGRILIPIDYRKEKVEDGKTKVNIYDIDEFVIVEILEDQTVDTNKKFDEIGRVIIDKKTREKHNWKEKDEINIWNIGRYFILKK